VIIQLFLSVKKTAFQISANSCVIRRRECPPIGHYIGLCDGLSLAAGRRRTAVLSGAGMGLMRFLSNFKTKDYYEKMIQFKRYTINACCVRKVYNILLILYKIFVL
jgi:hypothetical protein